MNTSEIETKPASSKKTKKTKQAKRTRANKTAPVATSSSQTAEMAITSNTAMSINDEKRQQMIETAAWLRAEKRGFSGENSMDDWLNAETEVDAMISKDQQNNPLI